MLKPIITYRTECLLGIMLGSLLLVGCAPSIPLRLGAGPTGVPTETKGEVPSLQYSPDRHPVIIIPGLQGTTLLDTTTQMRVWGAFDGSYALPGTNHRRNGNTGTHSRSGARQQAGIVYHGHPQTATPDWP